MTKSFALLALVAFQTNLRADVDWLHWTGPGGATPLTGTFATALGGTATATRTNPVDGGHAPGVPGPVAQTQSNLTSTYQSFYGSNPNYSIANQYNDTGDRYSVTLDFTGLNGGFLPTNVLFALVDFDSAEMLANMRAYTTGGAQIMTPWLSLIPGQAGYLDMSFADSFDESASMSAPAPTRTFGSGMYQFVSSPINMTVGFNAFRTTAPITRITYDHSMNTGSRFGGGGGGIAIGAAPAVPEPGTWGMLVLAATGFGLARWKRRIR